MILEEKLRVWQTYNKKSEVKIKQNQKLWKVQKFKKNQRRPKPKPFVQKSESWKKLVGPNMVPQHGHDLQLVVSQQTDMMDTTAGGVQQQVQQQQQINNMNHALQQQQQNMLESVLQSQVVNNQNEQQQIMGGQQQQISPVLFGSQMVDKNSSTPYTDATQVSFSF